MVDNQLVQEALTSGFLPPPTAEEEVVALCKKYPYFQAARLVEGALLAKNGLEVQEVAKRIGLFLPRRSVLPVLDDLFQERESALPVVPPPAKPKQKKRKSTPPEEAKIDTPKIEVRKEVKEVKDVESETPIEKAQQPEEHTESKTEEKTALSFLHWLQQQQKVEEGTKEQKPIHQPISSVEVEMQKGEGGLGSHLQRFLSKEIERKQSRKKEGQEEQAAQGTASETLAQILWKQGKLAKAKTMYEDLMQKYPQKSRYFASQIEKINKEL